MGRPKKNPGELRDVYLEIRMRPEYREWVRQFVKHLGTDASKLFEEMAAARAKKAGFEPPPER